MLEKFSSYLLYNANQNNENSIAYKLRRERLRFFKDFIKDLERPLKILDLGGSDYHWRNTDIVNDKDFHITIVNTESQNLDGIRNISFLKRDVNDLSFFDDKEYELVYSNSLIEHINDFKKQKRLASEIVRIGKHYFVQTPNYYFPIEPHFLYPFYQFKSDDAKTNLLMKRKTGWFEKQTDEAEARKLATSIRLLKKSELEEIFPGSNIYSEKYFLLTKSFIVYR